MHKLSTADIDWGAKAVLYRTHVVEEAVADILAAARETVGSPSAAVAARCGTPVAPVVVALGGIHVADRHRTETDFHYSSGLQCAEVEHNLVVNAAQRDFAGRSCS